MANLNIVEKVIALESVELLQGLKPEQLARVAGIASEMSAAPAKVLMDPAKPASELMIVLEGSVELLRNGEPLMTARQNDVLGAWSLFDDEALPIEARTLEDTRLLKISRDDFYDLLADNSEITQAIFSTLVRRFRRLVNSKNMDAEDHKFSSLGRLLAGVVHEINTPVGSILSNNEVIIRSLAIIAKDMEEGSETSLNHARGILETCRSLAQVDKIACERISGLVRGLKGFARSDSQEMRRVDLGEQILNTLKLVKGEYGRRVRFETNISELPKIECSSGKLNQVLLNLVVNAAQAIDCDGTVTTTAEREDDKVHIAIRDTGAGIPQELQSRIFHSGFTTKPAGEGTGLGLTISKQIIEEMHQGTLSFETAEGVGTTFHIRIPIERKRAGDGESSG